MTPQRRFGTLCAAVALVFLALVGRLFALQVVQGRHYEDLATRRVRRVAWLEPMRGTILDREGRVLARDRVVYDLDVVIPDLVFTGPHEALVANLEAAFRVAGARVTRDDITRGLEAAYDRIDRMVRTELARLGGGGAHARRLSPKQLELIQGTPQPFLRDVSRDVCLFVEANPDRFPGIGVRPRYARETPLAPLLSCVVGVTGRLSPEDVARLKAEGLFLPALRAQYGRHFILTDPFYRENAYEYDDRIGRTGLERALERRLRGVRGISIFERGRRGHQEFTTAEILYEPPRPGETLALTLSASLQEAAERALGDRPGAAVALDPATGEVLALASSPPPGPAGFHRAVRGTPPPASTVKVVTAVAGLEEGVIEPSTVIDCDRTYQAPGVVLGCWTAHGPLDLAEALAHSCNCYFYEVAHRLKRKRRVSTWMRRFGFGVSTGLEWNAAELPGEVPAFEDYLTAIGQGRMQATPLQVARMVAAVANGGNLVRPHLVKGEGGPPEPLGLRPETLAAVRAGMRRTVQEGLAAGKGLAELSAAGKTGTTQVVKGELAHSWFVGYAPAEAPRVAVCVFLEGETAGGGEAAAPVAAEILRTALGRGARGGGEGR